jgi:hypothetical protein
MECTQGHFLEVRSSYLLAESDSQESISRNLGSHIFFRQSGHRWRWGCQPYAPAALYAPETFLVLISVRGWVDPKVIVPLQRSGQLKNPMTSLGLEPATLRLVAQWLNQLRYRVPRRN